MKWNVNSIATDNFHRLKLRETQTSIFNYDLISICEISLNDSIDFPDSYLQEYIFISSNKPGNTRHGGVGLYYKNPGFSWEKAWFTSAYDFFIQITPYKAEATEPKEL